MIVRDKGEYCVKSEDGKKELGRYKTEKEAKKREGEIEHFKQENKRNK